MFNGCSSLTSLNLSNFETQKVENMESIFGYCLSLKYLNINNFKTSYTKYMNYMFYECNSLLSLNLTDFNTEYLEGYDFMFNGVNPNLTYCIDDNKEYKFKQQLDPFTEDCNYICLNIQKKKIIEENNICIDHCPNGTFPSYNNICKKYYIYNNSEYFTDLQEGYYIIDNYLKNIDKCDIKCRYCTIESMQNNLCTDCNINQYYYPKFNNIDNNRYINCYNNISIEDGYFLDNNIYMPCYQTCKKCSLEMQLIKNVPHVILIIF